MDQHPRDVKYEGYGGIGYERDSDGREFPLSKDTLFRGGEAGGLIPYSEILDAIHELREDAALRRAGLTPKAGGLAVNEGPTVPEAATQNGSTNGEVEASNEHAVLAETAPLDAQTVVHTNGAHANGNGTHLNGQGVQPNVAANGNLPGGYVIEAFMPPIVRSV